MKDTAAQKGLAGCRVIVACALGLVVAGCKRPAPGDAAPAPPAATMRPGRELPRVEASAGVPAASAHAAVVRDATSDAFRGGNWERCYAGYAPRSAPDLDVMRLGLLCGPSNGMRRVSGAAWEARAGDCFRVFVVGAAGVHALEVSVFDGEGRRIASTTGDRRWVVLEPAGAFCTAEAGAYRVDVRVTRGQGSTAAEVWRLR